MVCPIPGASTPQPRRRAPPRIAEDDAPRALLETPPLGDIGVHDPGMTEFSVVGPAQSHDSEDAVFLIIPGQDGVAAAVGFSKESVSLSHRLVHGGK